MALTGLYVMPVDWYHEFVQPGEDEEPQVLPRCCLCCFKFEPCDSIVVFNPRNPHLLDTWAGEYIEPERIEPTGWDFAKGRRPLEKVGYTELLPSVEAARVRRLKKRFAQELMAIVGYRLPLEICENIGRYCLSEYATKLINDVWSNKDFAGPRHATLRVTKSRSIWAQHVEFEGLQYIKSLSTTRKSESDTKLFEATSGIRVSVYFAEGCLGIREVVITQDDNTPSLNQDKGLRWVVNRRKALPFSFEYKTDGLKLRDLAITERKNEMADYRQRRWAVLPDGLDISQLAPPPPGRNNEPIRAVDWNLPGCRGYSVLIDEQSICDIISNNMGGPSSQLVDVSNEHEGDWFYVPVDRDERIAELWLRIEGRGNTWHPIYKSLVASYDDTLNARCVRIKAGALFSVFKLERPASSPISRSLRCRRPIHLECYVASPTEQRSGWASNKQRLGTSTPSTFHFRNLPSPLPTQAKGFFASTAELRDVRTVAVCRNWRYSKDVGIVGMLLTYADGHQRSLGQIRLDYMEAPLMVASGKIWLGCDKPKNWLEVDEPLRDKNREYFELPLTGSLEWQSYRCWDYTCHSVCHHESSELKDEMDQVLAREAESGGRAPGVVKTFSVVV
ncbi:hypothetical protein RAB80_001780 [Fusarium oxysporum f. sp. vasinfectum]|nr:hypothetical protein RAB80_001780 [Fusarium oxysporum f. sp. vasinfectum]